jgi:hypothetical protein
LENVSGLQQVTIAGFLFDNSFNLDWVLESKRGTDDDEKIFSSMQLLESQT